MRSSVLDVALAGNLISDHCTSFSDAAEEEKITNNFYKNLDKYTQSYIDKILILISKSDERDLQGDTLNEALNCYSKINWEFARYLNRHNNCPSSIPTDSDFQNLEDSIDEKFPVSAWQYLGLYGKLVVIWKIGYGIFTFVPEKEPMKCKMKSLLPDSQAGV